MEIGNKKRENGRAAGADEPMPQRVTDFITNVSFVTQLLFS